MARQCAAEGVDHPGYLLRLSEQELIDRDRRMVQRRIRQARFPTIKSLESFAFTAIASLNKTLVLELARCEYIARRENIIASSPWRWAWRPVSRACPSPSPPPPHWSTGSSRPVTRNALCACSSSWPRSSCSSSMKLGFVPLSKSGAELLFEIFSQRYERGSILVTSNLPFEEWTEVFGSARLTGALLD